MYTTDSLGSMTHVAMITCNKKDTATGTGYLIGIIDKQ